MVRKLVNVMSSLADHIERYIKTRLQQSGDRVVEINRAQLADDFSCVPSQINYVLTTRFTVDSGYIVESRRGGGGYIRILQVPPGKRQDIVDDLVKRIGSSLSEADSSRVLSMAVSLGLVKPAEARLVRGVLQQESAGFEGDKDVLRAKLLRSLFIVLLFQRTGR